MGETRRAAFFDCDKTLIPGSSLYFLARGMYARDYVRLRQLFGWAFTQIKYQMTGHEQMGAVDDIQSGALQFVKGRHQDELRELGREITEERILPRVYEDIASVISWHNDHGFETYLVTAAPQELADAIAKSLGMTGALGTRAEIDDAGRYTGRMAGPLMHGPEKGKAVQALAVEKGIDLEASHAYSDSKNDLPLLEVVAHAHAVNPDGELRRMARARGWPIQELRTRRRALLIGVPSTLGAAALVAAGVAIGIAISRRTDWD